MSNKGRSGVDKAIGNLVKWIESNPHWASDFDAVMEEHLGKVADAAGLDSEEVMDEVGPVVSSVLFGCALEDLMSRSYDEEPHNLVDDYLKRRGWRETAQGRRYLQGLRDATMSLYEVVNVNPGRWVEVRDLLRPGPVEQVAERSGSQGMAKWDRLAARVLPDLDRHIFSGVLLPIPNEAADRIVEAVQSAVGEMLAGEKSTHGQEDPTGSDLSGTLLPGLAPAFTSGWLAGVLRDMDRPVPEMVNFEGDPVQFCEVSFPLLDSAADQIAGRLGAVPAFKAEGDGENWAWLGEAQGENTATATFGQGRRSYGRLSLRDDNLVLFTNSLQRAERGRELLQSALAGLLGGPPLTAVKSPQDALAAGAGAPDDRDALPPEQEAQIVREFFEQHYRGWLDQEIPALDGQTPRQAVGTAAGRQKVTALLKDIENHEDRRSRAKGDKPFDFGWLWSELGLPRDG
jgi:hypothetical protein